jgi:hypothetical protein
MSYATVNAWYNSDRLERIRLVAAYLALNGLWYAGIALYAGFDAIFGQDAAVTPVRARILVVIIPLVFAGALFNAARLLWARRKAGAYWGIAFSVMAVLQSDNLFGLALALVPVILLAMSWSEFSKKPNPRPEFRTP